MLDSNFMSRVKAEITATRKWLDANKDTIVEASKQQMAEKKAAAAGANGAGQSAIAANTPMGQQISQLKGMLQMLPDTHPQKAALAAQIAQLEVFATAQSHVASGTSGSAQANPFQTAFQNPLLANQSAITANPMQAMMMQWLQGMMSQQQQNPYR